MPVNLEDSEVATGLEKISFHANPKKGNVKECSNYCRIALISHASKVMLKILQARLQQYVNHEVPDVQAGFRKGRGTRDQIANIRCEKYLDRGAWEAAVHGVARRLSNFTFTFPFHALEKEMATHSSVQLCATP